MKTDPDFLADLSHELRTPLSSLMATVDALASTSLELHQREMVDDMQLAGEHLNRLISEMLGSPKIEAGGVSMELGTLSPSDLPKESAETCQEEVKLLFSGLKMMIAEDVLLNRRSLKHLLANTGVDLKFALDGDEALKLLKSVAFDVALIDLRMPYKNGLDVISEYRTYETEHSREQLAAIACSANFTADVWSDCEQVGFQGFLEKPFSLHELYVSILHALARK